MTGPYFDSADGMAFQTGGTDISRVLEVMAQRYIGANPPHGPVFRVTRESPVRKRENHAYAFPFGQMYPDMKEGQRAYAWAKLWVEEAQDFIFLLQCFGPVRLYHNGAKRFGSSPEEEAADHPAALKLKVGLVRGWNHFVLELGKNARGGCGAVFGTGNRKNKPYHFLAPSFERDGEEGWIYTAPLDRPLDRIPGADLAEAHTGAEWLPVRSSGSGGACRPDRLYGLHPGQAAYAWTSVLLRGGQAEQIRISGTAYSPLRLMWNGGEILSVPEPGAFAFEVDAGPEAGDLVACSICGEREWGFRIDAAASASGAEAALVQPRRVHGYAGPWLYLGPFSGEARVTLADYMTMDSTAPGASGPCYWMADEAGAYVRPFLENELFGRWNYPLGVTLFGLLETGKLLGREDFADYVVRHVEFATSAYAYSLWDRERFGAAGLNNQLSHVDSLDDCGSFGALAILAGRVRPVKGLRQVSDDIAYYIMRVQDRMDDGTLFREVGVSPSMHNTMWCDDMYMSVPFLCRYAELSGDPQYVDEAARQLLLYKKHLYRPELQIMSHVYDVAKGLPSRTHWGRGNGWVFFSLAVLLGVLPKEHKDYPAILGFYRELAEGYLRLQGRNGLWHQVLVDPESYEEASCTSMFIYGFSLGVRHGWLERPGPYAQAAVRGWEGLCSRAIDKRGNLYGVCKGSSWSHSHAYYKHELGWSLNDTHGIGIVLLAGIETARMKEASGTVR